MSGQVDVWVISFAGTEAQSVAGLQTAFGIDAATAHRLVTVTPAVVKRGVDRATAERYRRALEEIRGTVQILPSGQRPNVSPPLELIDLESLPPVRNAPPPSAVTPGTTTPPTMSVPSGGPSALDSRPPHVSDAQEEPKEGLSKVMIAVVGLLVVAGLIAGVSTLLGDEEPAEAGGLDGLVLQERAELRNVEARRWLDSPRHLLMGTPDPAGAIAFVNALYRAGAVDVQIMHIDGSLQQFAATVDVELPESPAADEIARLAQERLTGGPVPFAPQARIERGERFMRIRFATIGPEDRRAVTLEEVDEMHELMRREKRGTE